MIVIPDGPDQLKAEKLYSLFSSLPLSEHIASQWSLAHLSALQRLLKPLRILEIGAGIGTLTAMLLYSTGAITAVEPLPEFREAHKENIGDHKRVTLVADLKDVNGPFDLMVVDGEFPLRWKEVISAKTVIFLEGYRRRQQDMINREFRAYPNPDSAKPRKGCYISV